MLFSRIFWRGAERLILGHRNRPRISVLIFHRVLERRDPFRLNEPTIGEFEKLMKFLSRNFNVTSLRDAVSDIENSKLLSHNVAITFDDGYADNVECASPILKKYGLPATFFIASGMLDDGIMWNDRIIEAVRMTPEPVLDLGNIGLGAIDVGCTIEKVRAIRKIIRKVKYGEISVRDELVSMIEEQANTGKPRRLMMTRDQLRGLAKEKLVEIGGHTISHPILKSISNEEAEREIKQGKLSLENIINREIYCFAFPNGIPNKDYGAVHVDMVRNAGYELAVSTSLGGYCFGADVFQIPRVDPWDRQHLRLGLRMLVASQKGGECVK